MIRGTTLKICVLLPENMLKESVVNAQMVFCQKGRRKLIKNTEHFRVAKGRLFVCLSQKDTLRFKAGKPLCIQSRVLFSSGRVLASKKLFFSVEYSLFRGILKGGRK